MKWVTRTTGRKKDWYIAHFMMQRTVLRMARKGGRSSGLSCQHFSIKSRTSGGQSRWPTKGRKGVVSCASTRSKIADKNHRKNVIICNLMRAIVGKAENRQIVNRIIGLAVCWKSGITLSIQKLSGCFVWPTSYHNLFQNDSERVDITLLCSRCSRNNRQWKQFWGNPQ